MDLIDTSVRFERALARPPLIRCNGKAPLDEGWTTGPFDDPNGWRERLRGHTHNVGAPTGRGLLVVDADTYKPGGDDSFHQLIEDTGLDIRTLTAITGRGGTHLWYRYDPALRVPSIPLAPRGYPGVEIKADRGQVIVEPSIHPDTGQPYLWEIGFGPGEIEPAPATQALLDLLGAIDSTSRSWSRWHLLGDDEVAALDPRDVECARLLVEHFGGHSQALMARGEIGVWRPGKPEGSASMTIGFIGPGVAKCWTDGWPPFVQNRVYDVDQLRQMAGIAPTINVPDVLVIPEGYRLWRPGDDTRPLPVLNPVARHGLVGRYLDLVEEQTEAAVAAVGIMALTHIGTMIGRRATIHIGEHRHHCNLFVLVTGETSRGAKGTADTTVERLVAEVDPSFVVRHVIGGFGSGEALVDSIGDTEPDEQPVEKRRVIVEPEFASVLRVARREQSILSHVIRQGFDYKPIQHRTKSGGHIIATGHHLSVIGSITPAELAASSTELDVQNGWLNRFMFVHSEIARILPFGGHIDADALNVIAQGVRDALAELDERTPINGAVHYFLRDDGGPAAELWRPWYSKVRFGTGSVPALTRRQHVHVPRIALILAVLDRATDIGVEHLRAAMAWSDFSVATVERLTDAGVAGRAKRLLDAIREGGSAGLDGRAQHDVFARNLDADALAALRTELEQRHLIVTTSMPTGGRPAAVSFAISPSPLRGGGR